jgi:hypothetical protein
MNMETRKLDGGRHPAAGKRRAQELVLLCAAAVLPPGAATRAGRLLDEGTDWPYLLGLASFQGVLPLMAGHLESGGFLPRVPRQYADYLKRSYEVTVVRNILMTSELAKVVSALRKEGIGTICLKGAALAQALYPNAYVRPVADMDILVRQRDQNAAGEIIRGMGYQPQPDRREGSHPFHREYCRKAAFPIFLELHWGLENKALADFPEELMWSRAQPVEIQGVLTRSLSPEDNLLFLANHFPKHVDQQLKLLCDIAELLKKYRDSLDWAYIVSSAAAWQIKPAVYTALARAQKLLGAPVPEDLLRRLRPPAWRYFLLEVLCREETAALPEKVTKLRTERAALVRGLMARGAHEMLSVLERYRGRWRRIGWLPTAFWAVVVFAWGLGRIFIPGQRTRFHPVA